MESELIANLIAAINPSTLWSILQMMIGLGAVIFVHELGHFLVAKACGVKCEKFMVGFDMFDIKFGDRVIIPRKLVHWTWGETLYGIGIVPLGGYVKMLGQDDNPKQIAEERQRSIQADADSDEDEPVLDPRSYQAKTVPQRMAIISAGVIMNLIFAVIFAAVAFRTSVNYVPPRIGATVPASPAWVQNLDGANVLAINDDSTQDRYYTYGHMLEAVVFEGADEPIDLQVQRPPAYDDLGSQPVKGSPYQPETLRITPTTNLIKMKGATSLAALGVTPPRVATLNARQPATPGQAAALADPPLQQGDRVVAANGKSILRTVQDANGRDHTFSSVYLLQLVLSREFDRPVELTLERKTAGSDETETMTTTIPPNPMRTLGVVMGTGPVAAVQLGSPAALAGIQPGDLLRSIDGQPVGDPFTLQQRMVWAAREHRAVEFKLQRRDSDGDNQEITLQVTPRLPNVNSPIMGEEPLGINSLGIAIPVTNQVVGVSGISDLKPGNKIVEVEFQLNPKQLERLGRTAAQPIDLKHNPRNWTTVHTVLQMAELGTGVKLTFEDDALRKTTTATVRLLDGFYQETRGFAIDIDSMNYQAQSIWEATQLGLQQTWWDATKVLRFLNKLIRGEIPLTGLGGPGTIVAAATSEASQGTSRLLLFLTLLSANLAIINFLPIPVLDGGHMVFLAYEGIFRRPVSERVQLMLSMGGLVFIIGLMLLVISLDVWRWSGLF